MKTHRGFFGFVLNNHYKVISIELGAEPKLLGKLLVAFIRNVNYQSSWDLIKQRMSQIYFDDVCLIKPQTFLDQLLTTSDLLGVPNGLSSAMDSEHTDFGYVLNLDSKRLELYSGNQRNPTPFNPFGTKQYTTGYYPCNKIGEFSFLTVLIKDIEAQFQFDAYDDPDMHC